MPCRSPYGSLGDAHNSSANVCFFCIHAGVGCPFSLPPRRWWRRWWPQPISGAEPWKKPPAWCDCNTLQHTATNCTTLQHTAKQLQAISGTITWKKPPARCECHTLQHAATLSSTLQHVATHCKTLHYTSKKCNTIERSLERSRV